MEATIAAPAPTAAPAAPAAAPTSAPVSAPVSAPTQATPTFTRGGVSSTVDPNAHPIREDYAAAVLKEKLAAIPEVSEEAPAIEVADPTVEIELPGVEPTEAPEVPAPDAEAPAVEEAAEEVPDFDFDPPGIATPELLSQMITSNPEFGKLLEADSRLKGQLFKTAREAAELQPYRNIFPDVQMAQSAAEDQQAFNGVRHAFMGSSTPDGAKAAMQRIAELSYERDENGAPILENGQPKIGEDFFAYHDFAVRSDIENRVGDVWQRFSANKYHEDSQYTTQEQVNAAYAKDMQSIVDAVGEIMGGDATDPQEEQLTPRQQEMQRNLDAQKKAQDQREQGGKVESRQQFEQGLIDEANNRMAGVAKSAIATARKNGAVIQPFLEKSITSTIKDQLLAKIKSVPGNIEEMRKLQALPANDAARTRRLAAIDRKIQDYSTDIVKDVFKEAGIQTTATAKERAEKREAQIETSKQTEIKGGTGRPSGAGKPMTSNAAYDHAEAEWKRANPGKSFGRSERDQILPRVVQLMTSR